MEIDKESFSKEIISKAKKNKNADRVEVIIGTNNQEYVDVRMQNVEQITRSESLGYGIRFVKGKKQAIVSSTDFTTRSVDKLLDRVADMCKTQSDDPYMDFNEPENYSKDNPELELYDSAEISSKDLIKLAKDVEAASLDIEGVTNSHSSGASVCKSDLFIANEAGFSKSYSSSMFSFYTCPIAGKDQHMQNDHDFCTKIFKQDLKDPKDIGKNAGQMVVKKLHPKKVKTDKLPLIFTPRVATTFLSAFASAINGLYVARGISFLKDSLGKEIFDSKINIIDNPHMKRMLGSMPFDAELSKCEELYLVKDGVLQEFLLDLATAKQLNLKNNGRASRDLASKPSPSYSNMFFAPGDISKEDLIKSQKKAIIIDDLIGSGSNITNGDYSVGASGFMVEDGMETYPVSDFTIAGNFNEIFKNITLANDIKYDKRMSSPTILIENMTVAGD